MFSYPKIKTVFKRQSYGINRKLLIGQYSLPEFKEHGGGLWECTEKVDGTNVRVIYDKGKVCFRGRTDRAQMPIKLIGALQETFTRKNTKRIGDVIDSDRFCIYGEGYGAGIQRGGNYSKSQQFVMFDILSCDSNDESKWLWASRYKLEEVTERCCVDVVPVVCSVMLGTAVHLARQGFKSAWGDFQAEGLVMKLQRMGWTTTKDRIIAKIKYKDLH